jgi:hypothetical protein
MELHTVSSSTPESADALVLYLMIFAHAQCFSTADEGSSRNEEIRKASRWRFRDVNRAMSCVGESWVYLSHVI